jgi:hypothetical protein
MFRTLKTIIKRSPIAPLAAFVYGLALPPGRREIMLQGLRYDRQTFEVMRLGVEPRDYTSFFDRLGHHARRWTGGSPRGLL